MRLAFLRSSKQAFAYVSSQPSSSHLGPLEGQDRASTCYHLVPYTGLIPAPRQPPPCPVPSRFPLSIWSLCLRLCICALCEADLPEQLSCSLPGMPRLRCSLPGSPRLSCSLPGSPRLRCVVRPPSCLPVSNKLLQIGGVNISVVHGRVPAPGRSHRQKPCEQG